MRNAALHIKRYFRTSRHRRIAQAPGCSTFTKCSTSKLIKAVEHYSIFKGLTNLQNFSTNVHGDEASAEYAKSRRASLENEFGHAIGSHGSSALSAYHRFGPFLAFYRAIVILTHVTLLSISHYFVKDIHKRAAKFRRTLIQLGPFYIKLGQALSTRPDILPNAYCQELTKLQDKIPPFPNKIAIECIEKELEAPVSMLFAKISEEPVAAASLGQVYKAQLQSGEVVAVKVQRPGMPLALALDANLIHIVGGHLKHVAKAHGDFLSAINEMVRHMFDEIDYVLEAQNAERFASLYAVGATPELTGRDRKSFPNHSHTKKLCPVKVPKIFWKFTRKSVLTMEWIDGIKLTDKDGVKEANLNIQQLIDQGVYCSLRQLLEEGFFHADPHPGNLVALKNGSLAYLDFGMMGDIPRHYRVGLIRSLVHYVNRDSLGLANDFLSLGFLPEDIDVKYFSDALKESLGDEGRKSNMDFQGVMNQLSDVMYEHMFSLPPDYALVLRALGSLEGTAKILDPDFKVLESAYPFIIGRLLADPDPDMRKVLRELLIRNDGSIRWHRLERLVMAIADESVDVDKNAEDNRSKRPDSMDAMRLNKWSFSFDMRAVAAATVDLLEFIFSGKGERVRIYLVQDIVKAINSVLEERDYGCATSLRTNSAKHEAVHEAQNYTEASNNDKTPVWLFKTIYGDSLSSYFQQQSVTYGSKPQQHNEENNGDERPNKHHGQHESSQQENDQNFLDRIAAGLLAFTTAVRAAPEVWLPLLLHLATRSEVQTFFVDVIDALTRSHRHKIPEAIWLKTSEFLHKHYKENS